MSKIKLCVEKDEKGFFICKIGSERLQGVKNFSFSQDMYGHEQVSIILDDQEVNTYKDLKSLESSEKLESKPTDDNSKKLTLPPHEAELEKLMLKVITDKLLEK